MPRSKTFGKISRKKLHACRRNAEKGLWMKKRALAEGLPFPEMSQPSTSQSYDQGYKGDTNYEKDVEKYVEVVELSVIKEEPVDAPDVMESDTGYNPLEENTVLREPLIAGVSTLAPNTITLYPPENIAASNTIIRPVTTKKPKVSSVDIKNKVLQAKRSDQEALLAEIEKLQSKISELTDKVNKLVNKKTDHFDDFGNYVSSKLRGMPLGAATKLERKLLEVLASSELEGGTSAKSNLAPAVINSQPSTSSSSNAQDSCVNYQVFSH